MRNRGRILAKEILCAVLFGALLAGCSQERSTAGQGELVEEWGSEAPSGDVVRTIEESPGATLGLKLKPGDRFPLRKVVEQELIQDSLSGAENRIHTRLELLFAMSVMDKVEDRTKLQVRYQQVKYTQRIGEATVQFDSTQPNNRLPVSLQPYQDMIGDGFTFWIGPDNQIVSVNGFTEFLDRALRNVPQQHRDSVVLGMESGSGESGIANFIDNSLGLLPYDGLYHPGDSWERPSHIGRPVPMHVSNRYTVKQLDKDVATIDIRGTITPSTTMTADDAEQGVRVTVRGGETQGICTIFRETGLPQKSHVEQNIDMTVMMSGALQFNQRKKVMTTIEAFPVGAASTPALISRENSRPELKGPQPVQRIRQVSGP